MDTTVPRVDAATPFSSHGLVRLSMDALLSLPFAHLASGVDASGQVTPAACGKATSIAGYTEWVSLCEPHVSLGWDWSVRSSALEVTWVRTGLPRSNILLIDSDGRDIEWSRNLQLLATIADALPWKEFLPKAVALRYA